MIGFHPHYTQKVALSAEAVPRLAALPFVRWVGLAQEWQKLAPGLEEQLAAGDPDAARATVTPGEAAGAHLPERELEHAAGLAVAGGGLKKQS